MGLSSDLIREFAKQVVVERSNKNQQVGSTVEGTAKLYDGKLYVQLDGSDGQLTPIASSTAGMKDGDRVLVTIKEHTAKVTGNVSSPSAGQSDLDQVKEDVSDQISEFEIIIADKVDTDQLNAVNARIDTLVAEDVTIKGDLTAVNGKIDNLEAGKADIGDLNATNAEIENLKVTKLDVDIADMKYATIENLEATNADIHNLEADYGSFKELTTDNFDAVNADIDNLTATKLSAEQADIKYAQIDFANIGEAAIENLFTKSGIIGDLVMDEGHVTGTLVGVTIIGDLIEGGTVKADKLVVQGEDGLYYKLNVSGESVAAEQTEYNSLNGSIITANTITAEKINVSDLVAFDATIGGFKITEDSIYSGVKSSAGNTTRGVFMNDDGEFAIGDQNNFLKFFKDTDGTYKLAISANSIKFGATSQPFMVDSVEEFYLSTSRTSLVGGSWSETAPTATAGKYIWRRTKVTFSDDSEQYSPSETGVCISGSDGVDGSPGTPGTPGKDGTSVTITSTSVTYQASSSGTTPPTGTWSDSVPSVSAGQYLWTKTVVNYSDGKSTTSYSVGRMGQNGSPGSPGAAGDDGRGIQSTAVTYQAHSSQTSAPTGTWSSSVPTLTTAKPYLWTRTVITYTDSTTSTSYSVSSTLESFAVGGRNLLKNSTFNNDFNNWEEYNVSAGASYKVVEGYNGQKGISITRSGYSGTTRYGIGQEPDTLKATIPSIKKGDVYTISAWVKVNTALDSSDNDIFLRTTSNGDRPILTIPKTATVGTWIKYQGTHTFTSDAVPAHFHILIGLNGSITISNLKLERGTKPTDWTPAPEDMATAEDAENAQNSANEALNQAGQNAGAIQAAQASIELLQNSIASLVTDENGSSLMTQTSDGWTFNIGGLQSDVEAAATGINEVKGDLSQIDSLVQQTKDLADDIAEKTAYMTLTQDSNGDPALELGNTASEFKIRITNTSIDFMEGTSRIAYLTNKQLYIQSSVVTDEMKIGATSGFVWKKRANGNMGLRWVSS